MQNHESLDEPLKGDKENLSLLDVVEDTSAGVGFESVVDSVWNAELHKALLEALELLPDNERITLNGRYLEGRSPGEIAEDIGVTENRVYAISREGTARMRRQSKQTGLYNFWDEESPYNFTGLSHFRRTGCSSEETLLQIKERREARRLRA